MGIELTAMAVLKRVADGLIPAHPVAQFNDGRLVRGEVDEAVSGKHRQHIEVVRQFPVHLVCLAVRAQIRRVNQEHNAWHVLVSLKHLPVVAGGNGS